VNINDLLYTRSTLCLNLIFDDHCGRSLKLVLKARGWNGVRCNNFGNKEFLIWNIVLGHVVPAEIRIKERFF
ncbi:hypothetical protein Bhyg_12181, partial [Pseudolycoriella hygida]